MKNTLPFAQARRSLPTRLFAIALLAVLVVSAAGAQDLGLPSVFGNTPEFGISARAEIGILKVLSHRIQLGEDGGVRDTGDPDSLQPFDYVLNGGQDILFPYDRYQIDLRASRNTVTLLYQPLTLDTQTVIPDGQEVVANGVVFASNPQNSAGLNLRYGFDFWRLSWRYNLLRSRRAELGAGLSLQIRNASIRFESADGSQLALSQNIGPVPAIKLFGGVDLSRRNRLEFEADGFYATSAFFNGASFEFEGSVLDTSLTLVRRAPGFDGLVTLRFIGGGARGTDQTAVFWTEGSSVGSGFTDNFLTSLALSVGARLR